jgi:acetylornithine deacetylase
MKGFFPLIMAAVSPLLNSKFREPLIILATSDEETSMQGARTLAELGRPKARSAVIGEPTGLQPVRAHKGMMMESIRLLGRSGHSSDPSLGLNALDAMHAVINDLMIYRNELKTKYTNTLFDIPYPTLNLGCIHGGDNPNRICGSCELEFDVRLMPGMHIDTVREEIKQRVKTIVTPLGISMEMVPLFTGVPAFFAEENSQLIKLAEELSGNQAISVAFGTEGPFLQQLGMDTIIMGPGNIDQAHQPDEYMSLDMINPCIDLLTKLITRHCLH